MATRCLVTFCRRCFTNYYPEEKPPAFRVYDDTCQSCGKSHVTCLQLSGKQIDRLNTLQRRGK